MKSKIFLLLTSTICFSLCSCEISEKDAIKISNEINNAYQNVLYLSLESHSYGYDPTNDNYYDIRETTESINKNEFLHVKQEATVGETKYVQEAFIVADDTYGQITYFKKEIEGEETIEYAYVQNSNPDVYYNHYMDVYMLEMDSYHDFTNLFSTDAFIPFKNDNQEFVATTKVYASNKNRDLKVENTVKYKRIHPYNRFIKKTNETIIIKNYLVTSFKGAATYAVAEKEERAFFEIKATYPSSLSIELPPHWEEKIIQQ